MLLSDCKVTTYICTDLIFTIKIRLQSRNESGMNQKWKAEAGAAQWVSRGVLQNARNMIDWTQLAMQHLQRAFCRTPLPLRRDGWNRSRGVLQNARNMGGYIEWAIHAHKAGVLQNAPTAYNNGRGANVGDFQLYNYVYSHNRVHLWLRDRKNHAAKARSLNGVSLHLWNRVPMSTNSLLLMRKNVWNT